VRNGIASRSFAHLDSTYLKEILEYGGESIMKVFCFTILILHTVCPAQGAICRINGCSCKEMEQCVLKHSFSGCGWDGHISLLSALKKETKSLLWLRAYYLRITLLHTHNLSLSVLPSHISAWQFSVLQKW